MNVILDSLTGSLGGSLEERTHVDVETAVGITRCYYLGAAVVSVLTHLGNHDTRATALFLCKLLGEAASFLIIGVALGL